MKVYSVKLLSLSTISHKCYMARAYNGSEARIPASCVIGKDYSASGDNAWWIAAWIVERSGLQHSKKRAGWRDSSGKIRPFVQVLKYVPPAMDPIADPSPNPVLVR